jgi:hypothetical protein
MASIIIPKYIDLISTNVTDGFSQWELGTTYPAGEKVHTYYSDRPELITIPTISGAIPSMTFDLMITTDGTFDGTNTKYTWDGTQVAADIFHQIASITSTKKYLVVFEIADYVAGNARAYAGGGTGTNVSADGFYEQIVTASTTDQKIGVEVDASFSGSIRRLSVKQIGTTAPKKRWESQASQSGNYPPVDDTTNWVELGYSQSWMMFDDYTSSQTVKSSAIEVEIESSKCNSLVVYNVNASSMTVLVEDQSTIPATELLNETYSFYQPTTSASYWDYFYADIDRYSSMRVTIPIAYNTTTTVTFTPLTDQDVKVGHVQVGRAKSIGKSQYGLNAQIKSWGRKDENDFGEVYLKKGKTAKKLNLDLFIERGSFDDVFQALEALDSTPIGFDMNNDATDYTTLVIYGFYLDFQIVIPNVAYNECNLEIQELA